MYQTSDKIDHQELRYGASDGIQTLIHANLRLSTILNQTLFWTVSMTFPHLVLPEQLQLYSAPQLPSL